VEEPAAADLKARGNARFKEGKFGEAFLAYSRAIARMNLERLEELQPPLDIATPQDVLDAAIPIPDDFDPALHAAALQDPETADLFYALLANRAAVAARLGLFRRALTDVEAALVVRPGDARARLRKAQVLTRLQRYEEALEMWKELGGEFPKDRDVKKMADKVRRRMQEAGGVFDFFAVDSEDTERAKLGAALGGEEYADFVGPIEVVEIAGKGRGVVASHDISKGTLLLCDRALVVAASERRAETVAINERRQQLNTDSQIRAVSELVQRMKDDDEFARRVYNLHAGDAEKPPLDGEGKIPVDHLFVQSAVEFNAFRPQPIPRVADPVVGPSGGDTAGMTGVWSRASMFNHSCVPNTTRNSAGESLMIFATTDIREGEEITVAYCPKEASLAKRTDVCEQFGFRCTCELCEYQRTTASENIELRGQLLEAWEEDIMPKLMKESSTKALEPVLLFLDKLNTTYAPDSPYEFEKVEILDLLGMLYEEREQYSLARQHYTRAYRASGGRDPRFCKLVYRAIVCGSMDEFDESSAPETERLLDELDALYALRAGGDLVAAQRMVARDVSISEAGGWDEDADEAERARRMRK